MTIAGQDLEPAAPGLDERLRTANRIFRGAFAFNAALTAFWLFFVVTRRDAIFFGSYDVNAEALQRVGFGILFFYVIWGFIWYGIKALLLKYVAGFSKDERRQAFASRMRLPFDVREFLARHSERRIRIVDMIGRRGRFITLGMAGFFYMYAGLLRDPTPDFATMFLQDNLFDAVITGWVFLAFYYADNVLAAAFYGPQSRVMDGVLARANCLLITTLWTMFKFVMVPIGGQLATIFAPAEFAVVFALIWGSYIVADALAEVGGALFGKQTIPVRGIGDVNRKSIGGTVTGFAAALVFCLWVVLANDLRGGWIALAVVIAVSNTLLELFSPRGTDDFVMATANALICWAFGALILGQPNALLLTLGPVFGRTDVNDVQIAGIVERARPVVDSHGSDAAHPLRPAAQHRRILTRVEREIAAGAHLRPIVPDSTLSTLEHRREVLAVLDPDGVSRRLVAVGAGARAAHDFHPQGLVAVEVSIARLVRIAWGRIALIAVRLQFPRPFIVRVLASDDLHRSVADADRPFVVRQRPVNPSPDSPRDRKRQQPRFQTSLRLTHLPPHS